MGKLKPLSHTQMCVPFMVVNNYLHNIILVYKYKGKTGKSRLSSFLVVTI